MIASQNTFDKVNQLIKVSIDSSYDPLTKALKIARSSGAFKFSNVVFQNYQLKVIDSSQSYEKNCKKLWK
jgi:pantothenate kinase